MYRCDYETAFDVLVGSPPNQKRFILHKDIMVQRSEYFAAARSGRWNENELLKATDLTAEDPAAFKNYLSCAYMDCVHIEGLEITEAGTFEENAAVDKYLDEEWGDFAPMRKVHRVVERYRELMKVYLLANMLLDHKTANLVVDETFRTLNILGMAPGIRAVALLYDNTIPGDGMRNLWADWYAHNVSILDFPEPEDEGELARPWPYDFLADVLKGVQEHKKLQWQLTGKRLVYRMDQYFLTWNPTEGPHRYYSGPGAEVEKLVESDDEDRDYEPPSEGEAVMTDEESTDTEMAD
jgi:hypothetical protein